MKTAVSVLACFVMWVLPLSGDSASRLFLADDILLMTPDQPKVSEGAFALKISGADAIDYARYLVGINRGESGPVSGTRPLFFLKLGLAAGSDSMNRNYTQAGAPHWAWHVSSFYGFVDGSETQSVSPLLVENDLDYWLNQDSVIFESYSVVGELPLQWTSMDEHGRKVSWFGQFTDDQYPWINHSDYGWLYLHGFDPDALWFWSLDQAGWFWISENAQDYIYHAEDGHWLYRGPGRWFYDFNAQAWLWGIL